MRITPTTNSTRTGVILPGLGACKRRPARRGCLLTLVLLLPLLAGCLNSPAFGGEDRRTDSPGPVGLDVTLKNNGSKPLPTWLNITGPAAFEVRKSLQMDVNEVRNFSYVLSTRGNYSITVDWWTRGESVEVAGQTLVPSGSFRGSDELTIDTTDCAPNSKIRADSVAWYYNAGNPLLNPVLKHGLHTTTSWGFCEPA